MVVHGASRRQQLERQRYLILGDRHPGLDKSNEIRRVPIANFRSDPGDVVFLPELEAEKSDARYDADVRTEGQPPVQPVRVQFPAPGKGKSFQPVVGPGRHALAGIVRPDDCRVYSTVTDFARFLGWSTSVPRSTAT